MTDGLDGPETPPRSPAGYGKPDGAALRAILDLLVADPALKPTTAIKRTIGDQNPSTIRRFQVKWKSAHLALLDEARQRREGRTDTNPAGPLRDLASVSATASAAVLASPLLRDAMMASVAASAAMRDPPLLRDAMTASAAVSAAMRASPLLRDVMTASVAASAAMRGSPLLKEVTAAIRLHERFGGR